MGMKSNLKKAKKRVPQWDPMQSLHDKGVRSQHAYAAAIVAVALSLFSWVFSRRTGKDGSDSGSGSGSGRWGLFIGQWAPTLLLVGLGLKHEEK